jgi:hypothetical protein
VILLYYYLFPDCICDKTLAPRFLVSLDMIAQNYMDTLELFWERETIGTKPIGAHVSGYAQELRLGRARPYLLDYSLREIRLVDIHADEHANAKASKFIYRILLMISGSNGSTVGFDLQIVYTILSLV